MAAAAVLAAACLVLSTPVQAPFAETGTEDAETDALDETDIDLVDRARECQAKGTAPTTTMDPQRVDRLLEELHDTFEGMPGFVDVYFYAGQDPAFRPTFVQEIPDAARETETQVPVAFDVIPERPQPAQATPPALSNSAPGTGDVLCQGIRPGAALLSGCTVNYVFTDGQDLYMGTAGHCHSEGDAAVIVKAGNDRVHIGDVVFSTGDGGVGDDFALIKIRDAVESRVHPEMCDWGGPTGTHHGSILGRGVLQTGHGSGVAPPAFLGSAPPRPKPGAGVAWGHTSFTWLGNSIPGDSGSPARIDTGGALGTVTHLLLVAPTVNFGTTWDHGLELAANAGYDDLELVTVADPIPS